MTTPMTRVAPYRFTQHLPGTTFDEAVERITGALQKEGFGVLAKIDVKDTLKKTIDVDVRRYVILGAFSPSLAPQTLGMEKQAGLRIPCDVAVQETGEGDVVVSIADPREMLALVDHPDLQPVADEASRRLGRAMHECATAAV